MINKDRKVALEAAVEMSFPIFVGSTIAQIWQAAVAKGNGGRNHTQIHVLLKDIA